MEINVFENVTKADALKAMDAVSHREIVINYNDFSLQCQVDLSVLQQNFLIDAVFDKSKQMFEKTKSKSIHWARSAATLRSLLEWTYLHGWTNLHDAVIETVWIDPETDEEEYLTDRQLHNLATKLNVIEHLSNADSRAKRMFDTIWLSILRRSELEEKLLAANLANQKLNEIIEKAEGIFAGFANLAELFEAAQGQEVKI